MYDAFEDDDWDWCADCRANGDDYYYDEDGELCRSCDECVNNPIEYYMM